MTNISEYKQAFTNNSFLQQLRVDGYAKIDLDEDKITFNSKTNFSIRPFSIDLDSDGGLIVEYDKTDKMIFYLDGLIDYGMEKNILKTAELFDDLIRSLCDPTSSAEIWKKSISKISRLYVKADKKTYVSAPYTSSSANYEVGYLIPFSLGVREVIR